MYFENSYTLFYSMYILDFLILLIRKINNNNFNIKSNNF